MTSSNSTAVYSEGDLSKLLGYVRHIKSVGGNYGFSACIVGKSSVLPLAGAPNRFLRSLDAFLQYVPARGWLNFGTLKRAFGSIFPLYQLLRSESDPPCTRPDDIWFPAKADVLNQSLVYFIPLCSGAVYQGYSPFSWTSFLY